MADLITRGIEYDENGTIVHEWERIDTVEGDVSETLRATWTAAAYAVWAAEVVARGRSPIRLDHRADRPNLDEWKVRDGSLVPIEGRTPRTSPAKHDRQEGGR